MPERNILFLAGPMDFQVRLEGKILPWKIWSVYQHMLDGGHNVVFAVSPHFAGSIEPGFPVKRLRARMYAAGFVFATINVNRILSDLPEFGLLSSLKRIWLQGRIRFFTKLFSAGNFDLVFGIGLSYPELVAAKKLSIPCVEVQHGVLSNEFFNLNFPQLYPTAFAHWFEEDRELIEARGIVPLCLGAPSPTLTVEASDSHLKKKSRALFILQYGFTDSVDGQGTCHRDLQPLIEAEHNSEGTEVVFRFHPVSTQREQLRASRVLEHSFHGCGFSFTSNENLGDAILGADRIYTFSSGAWVDAALLGKRTAMISDYFLEVGQLLAPRISQFLVSANEGLSIQWHLKPTFQLSQDFSSVDTFLVSDSCHE